MMSRSPRTLSLLALAAGPALALGSAPAAQDSREGGETPTPSRGVAPDAADLEAWREFIHTPLFRELGLRCGTPGRDSVQERGLPPSDCSYSQTIAGPAYDPTFVYTIPVVVHVIQKTDGTGFIPEDRVRSQIDILNEDFQALAGSNGENGTNGMIQFYLANKDPQGNPTNGITYSMNDTWFNDGGSYWNSLHWDTSRYMNMYTNSASGALGYVPDLPQGGISGSANDRIVVLWSAFGRNAPIGPPYNKGRTATHEVGHYLGLYHTFEPACDTLFCESEGDTVCDTEPELTERFGCPQGAMSCLTPDPIENYMDYTDDLCMEEFTPIQVNRMRCSIEFYRSTLPADPADASSSTFRNGTGTNPTGFAQVTDPIIGTSWDTTVDIAGGILTFVGVGYRGPAGFMSQAGELLIQLPTLKPISSGTGTHSIPIPFELSLVGRTFWIQGAVRFPGQTVLQNAIDIQIGCY